MSETVFEKQKMKITLLGQSLWLTESNTQDFLDLTEFIIKHGQSKEIDILMYQNAYSLRNALLYNVESLPWWRFIKRFKLKRFISTRTLLKKLSRAQLNKYSELVLEIEGLKAEDEVKKKSSGQFLGIFEGYTLLMFFLNFTINEIHKMPITIYYKLIEQCFNLGNMTSGGGYKMSSDAESKEFKTMQAFREIQERKRLGKW